MHEKETQLATRTNQKITKRTLTEDAVQAAIIGDWEKALKVNDEILSKFAHDAETFNRKGRALIELRQLNAAHEAYIEALKSDPANMIARRNLQRLEMLYSREGGLPEGESTAPTTIPRSNVFIEEVGRTWVDELTNPAEVGQLSEVSPGMKLQMEVKDGHLRLISEDGVPLGEVEARTAGRVIELMDAGNRFEVYALGISGQSLRFILRELHRDPANEGVIAFPRQIRATQDLMREREALFALEEGDFSFGEDEETDSDDSPEAEEPSEEDDPASLVGDAVAANEDDEQDPE